MSAAPVLTPLPKVIDAGVNDFDDDRYEVVNGVNVELPPMSTNAQMTAFRLAVRIEAHASARRLGTTANEVMFHFHLPTDPRRQRKPDVAFVSAARWPVGRPFPNARAWDVLPELCVEVVSPTDEAEDARGKVEEYFTAGVSVVWVVYPILHVVDVFEAGGTGRTVRRADTLDGGAIIPEFVLPLAELFPAPPAA